MDRGIILRSYICSIALQLYNKNTNDENLQVAVQLSSCFGMVDQPQPPAGPGLGRVVELFAHSLPQAL